MRRIAALYEEKKDLASALQWYEYASHLMHHSDAAVARKALEIKRKMLDMSILDFEAWLEKYGAAEGAGEVRAQLADLKRQKAETLLAEAKKSPASFPADAQGRVEL